MTEECYNILCDIEKDKKIEELQAEIKELNDDNVWWTNRFNAVERNNRELLHKSHSDDAIITKAIEYIVKETKNMPKNGCKQRLNELLKILKGSDKE